MRIGKNMKHALDFARRFVGWHTYAKDRATIDAINKLRELGVITTNQFHQFKRKISQ